MLLLAVVVILIVGVFSSTEMTDAQTQVESNYRVPVIGTYNLVRTDAVCYSHIGSGRTGTRYMDISLAGPSSSDYGMPVYSSGVGTVVASGTVGGYGLHVRTENSEVGIIYAHLSKIYVSSGQNVARGQLLGFIGNTGNSRGTNNYRNAGANRANRSYS